MFGAEMLMNALCKSIGMEPEQLKVQAIEAYDLFRKFVAQVDSIQVRQEQIAVALWDRIGQSEAKIISAINHDPTWPDDALFMNPLFRTYEPPDQVRGQAGEERKPDEPR